MLSDAIFNCITNRRGRSFSFECAHIYATSTTISARCTQRWRDDYAARLWPPLLHVQRRVRARASCQRFVYSFRIDKRAHSTHSPIIKLAHCPGRSVTTTTTQSTGHSSLVTRHRCGARSDRTDRQAAHTRHHAAVRGSIDFRAVRRYASETGQCSKTE